MNSAKTRNLAFAVALLAAPAAMAQTQAPAMDNPAATHPMPPAGETPASRMSPSQTQAMPALIGMEAFSSDQSRLGKVERVVSGPDGKVSAILIKTGGFLGFGGKMVSIPDSKFTLRGSNIQVQMTADEVSKLPAEKNKS